MDYPVSRRVFLAGIAAVVALGHLPAWASLPSSPARRGLLLVGARTPRQKQGVALLDLAAGKIRHVPLEFMPHSLVQSPVDPSRVWAIRHGYGVPGPAKPEAAGIDIDKAEVVQWLTPAAQSQYFGHGFFTPDGSALFISRHDLRTGNGWLTGYDKAGAVVADYPAAQGALHESHILPDGTVLAANSGVRLLGDDGERVAPNALLHLDLPSGKLLSRHEIDDPAQMVGHFHKTRDGDLLVLSRPHPKNVKAAGGKVFTGQIGDAALRAVPYTDDVEAGVGGECLSAAIDEQSGLAMVSDTGLRRTLIVDMKKGAFAAQIPGHVRGVSFDEKQRQFVLSGDALSLSPAADILHPAAGPATADGWMFEGAHSLLV